MAIFFILSTIVKKRIEANKTWISVMIKKALIVALASALCSYSIQGVGKNTPKESHPTSNIQDTNTLNSIKNVGKADLMTIYQQALVNDTQYKISEANLRAIEQGVRISRSGLLPSISASASFSRSENNQSSSNIIGSTNDMTDSQRYNIRLTQSIFNWANWIGLDQAELRVRASELTHAATLQNLMARTSNAYFNLLLAEENLAITQSETQALKQQLDLTREQYESGLANATDYLNTQANYDQTLANEVTLHNNLNVAREALRQLTDNYFLELEGVDKNLSLTAPSPDNLDDWARVASQENLQLKAQQMNVKVARQEVKRNRSGHYPSVAFNLDYNDSNSSTSRNSLPEINNFSDGYNAGVTVTVPIFSGFRTSAQTEQARQNYLGSTHQSEQVAREVQANVRNSYTRLKSAIASYNAYNRSLKSNQSSLEATREGYQAGTRNIIDVLNATRGFYNAQRNVTRAKYDYLANSINLKLAAGILSEQDLQKINQLLHKY